MAIFGGRKATEKDTENAVRASLEMHEMLGEINRMMLSEDRQLQMRVGLNFGEVVVTSIGYGQSQAETVYSPAVNLAARLEPVCPPGKVCVTAATKQMVEAVFDCTYFKQAELKGFSKPFELWLIDGLRADYPERWERADLFRQSPFIARDSELLAVRAALHAETASPVILNVRGSAGIGKSRFTHELQAALMSEDADYAMLKGASAAYFPPALETVRDVIRRFVRVHEGRFDQVAFESAMQTLGVDTHNAALLSYLLDFGSADARIDNLKGPELLGEIKLSVLAFLLAVLGECELLVVTLDDFQWVDELSLAVIAFLVHHPLLQGRVRWIINCREFYTLPNSITDSADVTAFELLPFTSDEVRRCFEGLLPGIDASRDFLHKLHQRSAGVPFFVEEYARLLLADGVVDKDGEMYRFTRDTDLLVIPDTLKSLILSRIDYLKKHQKEMVKAASVLGRTFLFKLLENICEQVEQLPVDSLKSDIAIVEELKYILEMTDRDLLTYTFKDILTRDTIYQTVLFSNRRMLHQLAAESLEAMPDVAAHTDAIAQHYCQTRLNEKARVWLQKAIDRNHSRYAIDIALRQARQLLELTGEPAHRMQLAQLLEIHGDWVEVLEQAEILQQQGELMADALYLRGAVLLNRSEYDQAEAALLESIELNKQAADYTGMLRGLNAAAKMFFHRGDTDKAKQLYTDAMKYATLLHDDAMQGKLANNLGTLAETEGDFPQAHTLYEQALTAAGADKLLQSAANGNLANLAWRQGDLDAALTYYRRQLALAGSIPWREGMAKAAGNLGVCLMHLERDDEAAAELDHALGLYRLLGDRLGECYILTNLADMRRFAGQLEEAEALTKQALPLCRAAGDRAGECAALSTLGDIAAEREDTATAVQHYTTALALATELDDAYQLAYLHYARGRVSNTTRDDDWSAARRYAAATGRQEILDAINEAD